MLKATIFLVVLALSGSSTGAIQCVFACTGSGGAAAHAGHHHGDAAGASHRHGDQRDRIGTAAHSCSHQDTATVAIRSSSDNSQPAPTFLIIVSFVSNFALVQSDRAAVIGPHDARSVGLPTSPLPLRI